MGTHTRIYSFLRNGKRKGRVILNLLKETVNNPGHGIRKVTAGAVKNPVKSGVLLSTSAIPVPGLGPAVASTPILSRAQKKVLSPNKQKKFRNMSREILSDSGKTKASRFGQKLEYHTNNSLMKLSDIASKFPI